MAQGYKTIQFSPALYESLQKHARLASVEMGYKVSLPAIVAMALEAYKLNKANIEQLKKERIN